MIYSDGVGLRVGVVQVTLLLIEPDVAFYSSDHTEPGTSVLLRRIPTCGSTSTYSVLALVLFNYYFYLFNNLQNGETYTIIHG